MNFLSIYKFKLLCLEFKHLIKVLFYVPPPPMVLNIQIYNLRVCKKKKNCIDLIWTEINEWIVVLKLVVLKSRSSPQLSSNLDYLLILFDIQQAWCPRRNSVWRAGRQEEGQAGGQAASKSPGLQHVTPQAW